MTLAFRTYTSYFHFIALCCCNVWRFFSSVLQTAACGLSKPQTHSGINWLAAEPESFVVLTAELCLEETLPLLLLLQKLSSSPSVAVTPGLWALDGWDSSLSSARDLERCRPEGQGCGFSSFSWLQRVEWEPQRCLAIKWCNLVSARGFNFAQLCLCAFRLILLAGRSGAACCLSRVLV